MYKHTATDRIHRPGDVVRGVRTRPGMSAEAWADLGCEPYTPPPAPPPEPGPFHVSKLALVELLISAGLLDGFLATLDANPPARILFDAANDLVSDNPHLTAMLPHVASALGKTEDEAMDMLRQAAQGGTP